ncbi:Pex2 / Pex12 amino terminal region [Cooperia oncophora]
MDILSQILSSPSCLALFGDNELSPECLDGITPLLKPSTISIPQKYTSFVAPIMSLYMHQQIRFCGASYWNRGLPGHGRIGPELQFDGSYRQNYPQGEQVASMDQIYVAFLRQYCNLAEPKSVFTFVHPNFDNQSNERSASISFEMDRPADLMGFAGYFHMNLYKDITLSIVPSTYSDDMISWFPAIIPLRELYRVLPGEKVTLNIERKVDDGGVWYEWFIHHTLSYCFIKVLYHVVHVPWQSPEDVKELLWRRHAYNNAVISLKEIFRQEIQQAEAAGKGVESMKEEEDAELNRLLAENDRINREKAEARARKEEEEWKVTQREILAEIDEALQKQHQVAKEATAEVRDAISRSRDFVNEENLEAKILEALEHPKVYDFAIDRQGKKTMQTYVAEIGEIVRAQRRDEEEIDSLQTRISFVDSSGNFCGERAWIRLFPYLKTVASVAYYSCTTLAGVQTLGEEYVKIFRIQSTVRAVPSLGARFLFVLVHALAPMVSQFAIQVRLYQKRSAPFHILPRRLSWASSIRNNPKARRSFKLLIEWMRSVGIPQLYRLHLAFFYIFGVYYNISNRVSGTRYLSLSPQTDLKALKVYRFLGYLTLAQTVVSLTLWIVSTAEAERNQSKNTSSTTASTHAKKDRAEKDDNVSGT